MCYLWSETRGKRDILGSDISSMSLSKAFPWCNKFIQITNC